MPPSEQVIPVTLPHSLLAVTAPQMGLSVHWHKWVWRPDYNQDQMYCRSLQILELLLPCQLKIRWQVLKLPQAAAFAT